MKFAIENMKQSTYYPTTNLYIVKEMIGFVECMAWNMGT